MKQATKFAVAGAATLALAGGVGAGIAYADPTTTPTPTASPTSTPTAGGTPTGAAKHRPLLRRALHGEVTLAGQKHRVVDFQRGSVDKVSASAITVKSNDGFTATYAIDEQTRVRLKKNRATVGDIKPGDKVRVVGVRDGSTVTAKAIGDRGQ